MKELLMLQGLPASGKSFFSKTLCEKTEWKRVNKDDLRAMVDGGRYTTGNEKEVLRIRNMLIRHWLTTGYNVVVDDTNLAQKHYNVLKDIADECNASFNVEVFTTEVQTCVTRDNKRANGVGAKVIQDTYNQFMDKRPVVEYDEELDDCVICDIDGTLACKGNRSPYDMTKVGEDTVYWHIATILDALVTEETLILFSGRDTSGRDATIKWLDENMIKYNELYMRDEGDNRPDTVVKQEMYENYVKDKHNVTMVIDDRPSVVRMWKKLGLPVLCADQRMYLTEF